jgi:hypothetical protein
MHEQFDELAKQAAARKDRRNLLLGLGALGLASLGLLGPTQETDAKSQCNKCKSKCQQKNKKKNNNKNKTNCGSKCRNKCRKN